VMSHLSLLRVEFIRYSPHYEAELLC